MSRLNEGTTELAALDWLAQVVHAYVHGAVVAPSEPTAERATYADSFSSLYVKPRDVLLPKLISRIAGT